MHSGFPVFSYSLFYNVGGWVSMTSSALDQAVSSATHRTVEGSDNGGPRRLLPTLITFPKYPVLRGAASRSSYSTGVTSRFLRDLLCKFRGWVAAPTASAAFSMSNLVQAESRQLPMCSAAPGDLLRAQPYVSVAYQPAALKQPNPLGLSRQLINMLSFSAYTYTASKGTQHHTCQTPEFKTKSQEVASLQLEVPGAQPTAQHLQLVQMQNTKLQAQLSEARATAERVNEENAVLKQHIASLQLQNEQLTNEAASLLQAKANADTLTHELQQELEYTHQLNQLHQMELFRRPEQRRPEQQILASQALHVLHKSQEEIHSLPWAVKA